MLTLMARLVSIVILRLGPQDLPAGNSTLVACIALYAIVTGISLATGESPENPVAILLLVVALPLVMCWIVLALTRKSARWLQTVSALFGTSALLSMLNLPFSLAAGDEPSALAALILVTTFFWSFAVDGHIWRHALEVGFSTGLALAVILFAASLFIIQSLAGPL
ncbi:MAG: hypothetical protein ACNA7J_10230 [Wenzhouxiangella sp.]